MKKTVLFWFLVLVLGLNTACAEQNTNLTVKDTISVRGVGEAVAEPDQAILSLTVTAINQNVNQAKSEADKQYLSVVAAAKEQKITKTNIKTSGLNVQPEYQWRNNTRSLVGTRVSRAISITVNDIDRVAPLLQSLVDSNVSTINNVQTGFKDRRSLERQALLAAIDDAKEKAQFLAQQFGKKLGSAYTISEQSHHTVTPRQYNGNLAMAKTSSADLPEEHFGTQKVKASINVIFHSK